MTVHHLIVDLMNLGLTEHDATDIATECYQSDTPFKKLSEMYEEAEAGVRLETRRANAMRAVRDRWGSKTDSPKQAPA